MDEQAGRQRLGQRSALCREWFSANAHFQGRVRLVYFETYEVHKRTLNDIEDDKTATACRAPKADRVAESGRPSRQSPEARIAVT